jgi:hypothetical protein
MCQNESIFETVSNFDEKTIRRNKNSLVLNWHFLGGMWNKYCIILISALIFVSRSSKQLLEKQEKGGGGPKKCLLRKELALLQPFIFWSLHACWQWENNRERLLTKQNWEPHGIKANLKWMMLVRRIKILTDWATKIYEENRPKYTAVLNLFYRGPLLFILCLLPFHTSISFHCFYRPAMFLLNFDLSRNELSYKFVYQMAGHLYVYAKTSFP